MAHGSNRMSQNGWMRAAEAPGPTQKKKGLRKHLPLRPHLVSSRILEIPTCHVKDGIVSARARCPHGARASPCVRRKRNAKATGKHSSSRFKLKVMAGLAKSPPFGRLGQSASPILHVSDSNSALNLDLPPWRELSVGSPFSRQNSETLHEVSAEM